MHDWAVRPNDWNSNLIVPGDFNQGHIGDPFYAARRVGQEPLSCHLPLFSSVRSGGQRPLE
jgi:hypothetical protein